MEEKEKKYLSYDGLSRVIDNANESYAPIKIVDTINEVLDSVKQNTLSIESLTQVTSNIIDYLKEVIEKVSYNTIIVDDSTLTQVISPDTLYMFTSRTKNLTLTLGDEIEGKPNEYHFFLTIGNATPTITWPKYKNEAIKWNGDSIPAISANTTYEISILNGIAIYIII